MESNRCKDVAKRARFSDYCDDVTDGKCRSSKRQCPVTASKEARMALFDKRRSKRIAAVLQEDFSEPSESKSAALSGGEGSCSGCLPLTRVPVTARTKILGQKCHVFLTHLLQILLHCKKLVSTISPEVVRPNIEGLSVAVGNAVYTMEVLPYYNLYAVSYLQRVTIKAAMVSTLVHVPDSSRSTVTRSSYHCLLKVRRLLKLGTQKANLAHSCLYYIDPPKYWKKIFNIPFFLKPATLVYKSSFPKDVMMKALKEYSDAQAAQIAAESVSNPTSNDVSSPLPNSDLKPKQKSATVNEPAFKVPSSGDVRKKRSSFALTDACESDSPPASKRVRCTYVKSPILVVSTDSTSPPAPKRLCQNNASLHDQPSSSNVSCSNTTGQYLPVASPLLKSQSAVSTPPQVQTGSEPMVEPPSQSTAPSSEDSESPMCTQENTDSPDGQSPQGPAADSASLPIPVPTLHQEKPARAQLGEKQSSTACYAALCKEARKASFDKRRSLRIATALAEEKREQKSADGSESETDDSDDSCDSDDESSDEEYDNSPDVKINGTQMEQQEEQQRMEKRKKLQLQASSFLLQLTKCLSTCKKDVYTLSPNFVKPNVDVLREAVDNALYVAERIKRVSVRSSASLKQLTQSAATVARLVHIPDSMHSMATKSSYHCLLRIRRFLNLSIRVAAVLHAYTEKIASDAMKSKSKVKIKMTLSDFAREADGRCMEVAEHHKLPNVEKTTTPHSSSAHWKASSKVPFFLKPAILVFDSSIHKEVLLNNLKKKLECLPALQSHEVQMVEPPPGPGKECDFDETCRDLHSTLFSDKNSKPINLIVSVPLRQLSSSKRRIDERNSTTSDVCFPPPTKCRAQDASRQFVLDDVVDVGVVQGNKVSIPSKGPDYDPGVGEMINDFLWKVRREVVEKQRSDVFKMQSTSKLTCKKKRYSPYAAGRRPSSAKTLPSCQKEQTKCVVSKTRSLGYEPQRKTEHKCSVASSQSEKMKPPAQCPNKVPSKPLKSHCSPPCSVASVSKPAVDHTGPAAQIQKQPKFSMDELADLVEKKCYPITITESLSKRYARLCFKDPHQYELTSAVIPRERYPGLLLQDGDVKFVLRVSPLTPVLFQMMMEGRSMNILPKNLLSGPRVDSCAAATSTSIDKSKQPAATDHKLSQSENTAAMAPSSFSSPPVCKIPSFTAVIKDTMDAVVRKRPPLKPTRRRLHPTLSNELAARKNPRLEATAASDREEYRGILGTTVEVNPASGEGAEQPKRTRLGKRNATAAGLPIPAGK